MFIENIVLNNLMRLIPILVAGILIFIGVGRLIVPTLIGEAEAADETGLLDRLWVTAAVMCGLNILLIYVLAALKLYEVLSLVAVYAALAMYLFRRRIGSSGWQELCQRIVVLVMDILDRRVKIADLLRGQLHKVSAVFGRVRACPVLPRIWIWLGLLAILGAAAYLRFGDPITHLAPAMSDAYVTMAWVKYIERRILFHDGLYTHGFHIYLSVLHKFSAVNVLYLINLVGPLNGVLITFSVYYTARRLTGSQGGGLAAALLYGVFLGYLPSEAARQSATNSQEFALVWLLPSLYWAWRYLQSGTKYWLWASAGGVGVIVLTHVMVTIFVVIGLVVIGVTGWVGSQDYFRRAGWLTAVMGLTGLAGVSPLLIGRLLGVEAHQSSLGFLTRTSTLSLPSLEPPLFWLLMLIMAGGFLAWIIAGWQGQSSLAGGAVFSLVLVGTAVAVYLGPFWGLNMEFLRVRSGEYLALALAMGAAWPASLLHKAAALPFRRPGWRNFTALALAGMLGFLGTVYYPPQVFRPYNMQYDAAIDTYLRINNELRPTQWTIVAPNEFYPLILGLGWHVTTEDFLNKEMSWRDGFLFDGDTKTPVDDLFIFVEKVPYPAKIVDLIDLYTERARQEAEMGRRLAAADWAKAGTIYYEDDQLVVYHYHYEADAAERFQRVWEDNPRYRADQ